NAETMDTFPPPIENPQGLVKRPAYFFTCRQFGKVLTPLKVYSARLPSAFGLQHHEHRPEYPFGHAVRHQPA
ncbi:MAG TPA: hypothetical protein VMH30_09725, partial [Verrucomicrobiae bacterium]|nr:hypothetical protein [Verrucomicrobiae bacterium]